MTKDDIILMADASGLSFYGMGKDREKFIHYLEAFADLVAAAEREECAKLCESYTDKSDADHESHGYACAYAIRARGNT